MMVTFISQCEKKALNRTRRVLDTFANRIGDNTWQTLITRQGLLAVKKLLQKTASKNTAVSCHWIRSRSRSELVWVVGSKDKFNNRGCVPVNSTRINRIHDDAAADWHYLPLIRSLAALAALLHDWGKASARFQAKLAENYSGRYGDALRHEWVSCLLLKAFILLQEEQGDTCWLTALSTGEINEQALKQTRLAELKHPMKDLPPTAQLLAWLIVSHHRLPNLFAEQAKGKKNTPAPELDELMQNIDAQWGYSNSVVEKEIQACLNFPKGLLSDSSRWLSAVKRWAKKLLNLQTDIQQIMCNGSYRVILHHARLSLMLADHCYSSQEEGLYWKGAIELIANTKKDRTPNQRLDQHLVGVCDLAKKNVRHLPVFERQALRSQDVSQLKKASPFKRDQYDFRWQDKAVKAIKNWRSEHKKTGFFAVNMASTGCGKTFANAKVMRVLAEDSDSLRYILALGLRTLTLQTGDEYRNKIFRGGDGSDLAVMIGSKAILELHKDANDNEQPSTFSNTGSESQQALIDAADEIVYEGNIPEEGLVTVLKSLKDRQFLHAPVLVCTIDHLMPATECTRGGRYILPCLRLMSSDLVIDEVDDFSGADSIAIGRLIHLAGMLGRKVMISSATIPPAMAKGYFDAYRAGWQLYAKTRGVNTKIGCAWIDEFRTQITTGTELERCAAQQQYETDHSDFISKRTQDLARQTAKRKARIVPCQDLLKSASEEKQTGYFAVIAEAIESMQREHSTPYQTSGLEISFGVVRMANIKPCVALIRFLLEHEWSTDTEVRVMPYHSQQVLLLRNAQEQHLDAVLTRKEKSGEAPSAWTNPVIEQHINVAQAQGNIKQLVFVLVATPVEEVGRDHDFDWAIIEPSSYRSIIQMAGRVHRHRCSPTERANVGILQYNWKSIEGGDKKQTPYFVRPGYESKEKIRVKPNHQPTPCWCRTHNLSELINKKAIANNLDAIPRIQVPQAGNTLAELEHAVINHQLNNPSPGPETLNGYISQHWYLTGLPQRLNRFRDSERNLQLYLAVDKEGCFFVEKDDYGQVIRKDNDALENREPEYQINRIELDTTQTERLWLKRDYLSLVEDKAQKHEKSPLSISLRYGELNIREDSGRYDYNDQLGLFKQAD